LTNYNNPRIIQNLENISSTPDGEKKLWNSFSHLLVSGSTHVLFFLFAKVLEMTYDFVCNFLAQHAKSEKILRSWQFFYFILNNTIKCFELIDNAKEWSKIILPHWEMNERVEILKFSLKLNFNFFFVNKPSVFWCEDVEHTLSNSQRWFRHFFQERERKGKG